MRTPAETALTLLWPESLLTGCAAAMVPPTRPVSAALSRSAFREVFIFDFLAWVLAESIRGLLLNRSSGSLASLCREVPSPRRSEATSRRLQCARRKCAHVANDSDSSMSCTFGGVCRISSHIRLAQICKYPLLFLSGGQYSVEAAM